MSLDSPRNALQREKINERDEITRSRKRKLCELYSIAGATEPIPPNLKTERDSLHDQDLARFLDQNDLERGRYFDESTLPARHLHPPLTPVKPPSAGSDQQQQLHRPTLTADPPAENLAPPKSAGLRSIVPTFPSPESNRNAAAFISNGSLPELFGHPRLPNNQIKRDEDDADDAPLELSSTSQLGPPSDFGGGQKNQPPLTRGSATLTNSQDDFTPSSSANAQNEPGEHRAIPLDKAIQKDYPSLGLPHTTNSPVRTSPDRAKSIVAQALAATASERPSKSIPSKSAAEASDLGNARDRSTVAHLSELATSNKHSTSSPRVAHSAISPSGSVKIRTLDKSRPTSSLQRPHSRPQSPQGREILTTKLRSPNTVTSQYFHDDFRATTATNQHASLETAGHDLTRSTVEVREGGDAQVLSADRPIASAPLPGRWHEAHRISKNRKSRRGRHPTFVVNKQHNSTLRNAIDALHKDELITDSKAAVSKRDYMQLMFLRQALDSAFHSDLSKLLQGSNKTLMTADWSACTKEEHDCRLIKRIYKLQDTNKWSPRQLKPCTEPPASVTHQDHLLRDIKWLQTDFREERKLKLSIAKLLADWCLEWVTADSGGRRQLQVKVESTEGNLPRVEHNSSSMDVAADGDATSAALPGNEDDTPSMTNQDTDDYIVALLTDATVSLNAILSTTSAVRDLLEHIPRFDDTVGLHLGSNSLQSDSIGTQQISTRRIESGVSTRTTFDSPMVNDDPFAEDPVPPVESFCALFNPESQPLRSRLNAHSFFRPPPGSVPPQAFYEHRHSSQWTQEEDKQLQGFVKDFPSNWSLISDRMTSRSLFTSFIDRRTPWECYERLLALEGAPADANIRQYTRHFLYRIEQAKNKHQAQQAAMLQAQQQSQASGHPTPQQQPKRFAAPVRVERKPQKRILAMLDCARKLAKRRETAANKQQAPPAPEVQASRPPTIRKETTHSPQYFSRMKYERECKEQERREMMQLHARQVEAQRKQQGQQALALQNGMSQPARNTLAVSAAGIGIPGSGSGLSPGQASFPGQLPGLQTKMPNGPVSGVSSALTARSQAALHAQQQRLAPHLTAPSPVTPENMQRFMQQQQLQQRLHMQQQLQQQGAGQYGHNPVSLPNTTAMASPALAGQFSSLGHGTDGARSPGLHPGFSNGQIRTSPQMQQQLMNAAAQSGNHAQSSTQSRTLSNGHLPQVAFIQQQIAKQNPRMTQEQVTHAANIHLQQYLLNNSRQTALNAATGMTRPPTQGTMAATTSQQSQLATAQPHNTIPYQQSSLLAQTNGQLRSGSPNINTAAMQGSASVALQSQYNAQIRQQMLSQRQLGSTLNGNPAHNSPSPAMTSAALIAAAGSGINKPLGLQQNYGSGTGTPGLNGIVRTPSATATMRPPSRSASMTQGPQTPGQQTQTQQQLASQGSAQPGMSGVQAQMQQQSSKASSMGSSG